MTRYRVRPTYAILPDQGPIDRDAVLLSRAELAGMIERGELVRPYTVEVDSGTPVYDPDGQLIYGTTTHNSGRKPSQPLVEHADELRAMWERFGSAITQQGVADGLVAPREPETVRDWFRGGHWKVFKATGKLPDR